MAGGPIALRRAQLARALRIVPYLTGEEVGLLAEEARKGRKGERDALLILLLFQTGLRISEALSLTPSKIELFEGRPILICRKRQERESRRLARKAV